MFALPQILEEDFTLIQGLLYIQYAGTNIGELMRDKLVPDHALAMSNLLSPAIVIKELDYDKAIKYLQRAEISTEINIKGWGLVSYREHPLGWINALPNRINNYYPKELRILKAQNGSSFQK